MAKDSDLPNTQHLSNLVLLFAYFNKLKYDVNVLDNFMTYSLVDAFIKNNVCCCSEIF